MHQQQQANLQAWQNYYQQNPVMAQMSYMQQMQVYNNWIQQYYNNQQQQQ